MGSVVIVVVVVVMIVGDGQGRRHSVSFVKRLGCSRADSTVGPGACTGSS